MIDYLVREIAIAISIINLAMGFTSRAVGIALLLLALYLFSIKILHDNIETLVNRYPKFDAFLIDMAIGLCDRADQHRPDKAAKEELIV